MCVLIWVCIYDYHFCGQTAEHTQSSDHIRSYVSQGGCKVTLTTRNPWPFNSVSSVTFGAPSMCWTVEYKLSANASSVPCKALPFTLVFFQNCTAVGSFSHAMISTAHKSSTQSSHCSRKSVTSHGIMVRAKPALWPITCVAWASHVSWSHTRLCPTQNGPCQRGRSQARHLQSLQW